MVFLGFAGTAIAAEPQLIEAARKQDSKSVRALLSQKADVHTRSSDGSTALLWAAHWSDLETADLLLNAGADANAANDFDMTPLLQACTNGNARLVRSLLKWGAKPNTAIATGETPLMTCAKTGSADAVRILIEYGADVNAKEPGQNQTALMWAAAERHSDVVGALIGANADVKAATKQGFTPIHFAARVGDLESVKLLLAAVTTTPAELLGLEKRVGRLVPGADGNVVLFSGDPLSVRSFVEYVVLDGEVVYDRSKDVRVKQLMTGEQPAGTAAVTELKPAEHPHDDEIPDAEDEPVDPGEEPEESEEPDSEEDEEDEEDEHGDDEHGVLR
jgi:ankyrin repeat protein